MELYYSGSKIVCMISFPIFYRETFTYYHHYSLTTENSLAIVSKNIFLIMSKNPCQYASLPCVELHPGYYCSKNGQPMLLPEVKIPNSHQIKKILKITIQYVHLDKIHEIQKPQNRIQPVPFQSVD